MGAGQSMGNRQRQTLYTPAERARRDATVWTLVQGILAPLQFLAFAVSLCLVINFLLNGVGLAAATISVVIKTSLLYAIMVTGAIWEKVVFGRYLFVPGIFLGRRCQHAGDGAAYRLRGDVARRLGYPCGTNVGGAGRLRELRRQCAAVSIEVSGGEKNVRVGVPCLAYGARCAGSA